MRQDLSVAHGCGGNSAWYQSEDVTCASHVLPWGYHGSTARLHILRRLRACCGTRTKPLIVFSSYNPRRSCTLETARRPALRPSMRRLSRRPAASTIQSFSRPPSSPPPRRQHPLFPSALEPERNPPPRPTTPTRQRPCVPVAFRGARGVLAYSAARPASHAPPPLLTPAPTAQAARQRWSTISILAVTTTTAVVAGTGGWGGDGARAGWQNQKLRNWSCDALRSRSRSRSALQSGDARLTDRAVGVGIRPSRFR